MDKMDMDLSDWSDDSVNRKRKIKRPRLSASSEDFVNPQHEGDLFDNEMDGSTTDNDDSESDLRLEKNDVDRKWQPIRERSPVLDEYSKEEEFLIENVDFNNPSALYKLFLTDNILEIIIRETNKYADQCIRAIPTSRRHQQPWQPVTKDEMDAFFGILLIMGIVQLPEIRLYWSRKDMYTNTRIRNAMKRDRFVSILKFLHFADDSIYGTEDRLSDIRNVVEAIADTFKNAIRPGKNMVIDESTISCRERPSFRKFIPERRHKYSIHIYKLCLPDGYIYNIDVHAGFTPKTVPKAHAHGVLMRLVDGLLYEGRILYIDNTYMSVPLAEDLLQKKTFVCGSIDVNKKFLPPQISEKQKQGDIMSFENHRGVKCYKWTEDKPICMLSTIERSASTIKQGKKEKPKPDAVYFYNNVIKGVDLSDQLTSCCSCLPKTVKWYTKVIIYLICGTCFTNAWYIHQKWGNKHINILQFREQIIDQLLINANNGEDDIEKTHFLQAYKEPARKSRKRCRECYRRLYTKKGRDYATKKAKRVTTYCDLCEGQPALCLKCFQIVHKNR